MANAPIAIPGKDAGTLFIPALGVSIKQTESREDDIYDTVEQTAAAVTAGTSLELFRDLSNKNIQHVNLTTSRRIASGSEFFMNRVGVYIHQAFGATLATDKDMLLLAHAGSLTFKLNDRTVVEGPLFKYQSGYGLTGSTTRNATGIVTIGVASYAAAPQLLVVQRVSDKDDVKGTIDFKNNSWLTGGSAMPTTDNAHNLISVFLHGVIKTPVGN